MATYIPRPTPLQTGRLARERYTAREVYEALLFELNKVSAPSIDVETFNHFHQTGRDNYYKRRYQLYDTSQLTTDQLAEMSATTVFTATSPQVLNVAQQQFPYPPLYYHYLSITPFFRITQDFRTFVKNDTFSKAAERVAAEKLAFLRDDHYNRPQLRKPYFLERPTYTELHTGRHALAVLYQVEAVYLLAAEEVILLDSDLDDVTIDPSQVLREKAVVTREVLKEVVKLVLENQSSQRVTTYIPVSTAEPNQLPQQAQATVPRSR